MEKAGKLCWERALEERPAERPKKNKIARDLSNPSGSEPLFEKKLLAFSNRYVAYSPSFFLTRRVSA
jgi:hypothetical protein